MERSAPNYPWLKCEYSVIWFYSDRARKWKPSLPNFSYVYVHEPILISTGTFLQFNLALYSSPFKFQLIFTPIAAILDPYLPL